MNTFSETEEMLPPPSLETFFFYFKSTYAFILTTFWSTSGSPFLWVSYFHCLVCLNVQNIFKVFTFHGHSEFEEELEVVHSGGGECGWEQAMFWSVCLSVVCHSAAALKIFQYILKVLMKEDIQICFWKETRTMGKVC